METDAENVRDILDLIKMPTGKETVYFPTWKSESIPFHEDIMKNRFIACLDCWETVYLGQMISEAVGERYTVLPIQKAYDLVFDDKDFNKMVKRYSMHNREVILKSGYIVPDPVVIESNGNLMLKEDCRKINVGMFGKDLEIDRSAVFSILEKAELMKKPKKRVCSIGISFEKDISSIRSNWVHDDARFHVYGTWPSSRSSNEVVAFVKTGEAVKKKPKMREIAESEYQQLLADSQELKKLKAEVKTV